MKIFAVAKSLGKSFWLALWPPLPLIIHAVVAAQLNGVCNILLTRGYKDSKTLQMTKNRAGAQGRPPIVKRETHSKPLPI